MVVDKSISNTTTGIPIISLNFYERIREISVDNPASQHFLENPCSRVVLSRASDICSNFSKAFLETMSPLSG